MALTAGVHRYRYRDYPTLEAAVFIAPDRREIVVWSREGNGWNRHRADPGQIARVAAIGCEIEVNTFYRDGLPPGAALARD